MINWRFGNLNLNGFSDEEQTGFSELTPDAGLPYRREVFSDIENLVQGQKTMTLAQYLDFKNFYRNETKQGTVPFTFYDCRVEQNRTARFVGKPTYSTLSNHYSVSVTLSLEPVTITSLFYMTTENGDRIIAENGDYIVGEQGYQL